MAPPVRVHVQSRGGVRALALPGLGGGAHLQLLHGHLLPVLLAALDEDVQRVCVVLALRALQLLPDCLSRPFCRVCLA